VTLVVRVQGMHATATFYSAVQAEQINVDLTSALANIAVIDTAVDAVKSITDQLRFTIPNQVDANALTGGLTASEVWSSPTRTLTGQSALIIVTGPVISGGEIHIVAGDDYMADDGRALEWSSLAWPNLAGASVVFHSDVGADISMTVVTAGTGIEQMVRLELTKTQTANLIPMRNFAVVATLADGHVVTLVIAPGYCR
jgi:hypothetical protein